MSSDDSEESQPSVTLPSKEDIALKIRKNAVIKKHDKEIKEIETLYLVMLDKLSANGGVELNAAAATLAAAIWQKAN